LTATAAVGVIRVVPIRALSAGSAIRLLAALVIALGVLSLPAAGASGDDGTARATGFGVMLDGGTRAGAVALSSGRVTRDAVVQGARGAAGAVGRAEVHLGAGATGPEDLAEATAAARDVLLLGGRIAVASLSVSVQARSAPSGSTAGLSAYSAQGLVVDGQPVDAVPGRQIDISGVGTLVLFEQVSDGAGSARANGLRLSITDPASGLPVGSQVVVGHVEAQAAAGTPAPVRAAPTPTTPAPAASAPARTTPAPSPDPTLRPRPSRTAPGGDTTTTPPGTVTTAPPTRTLPAPPPETPVPAPAPVDPGSVTPAPGLTPIPAPLALPRRQAPALNLPSTPGGYRFPVYGDASVSNDYGSPRADVDWHHGDDIFAPEGTPVLAVADGTLSKVGVNRLGGNRLWLTDEHGNAFYYAHLSAYAPAAVDGAKVRAGQVLGFVGHTGDAITTPPHLHFEAHPGDGDSVDPYPYLVAWQRQTDVPMAFRAATVAEGQAPAAGAILVSVTPAVDQAPDPDDTGMAQVAP
jgi:murein DD-endopeptidase MepM/ murein hydrolase activator NlpD